MVQVLLKKCYQIKAYTSDSYECPMLNEDHFVAFSFEIIEI